MGVHHGEPTRITAYLGISQCVGLGLEVMLVLRESRQGIFCPGDGTGQSLRIAQQLFHVGQAHLVNQDMCPRAQEHTGNASLLLAVQRLVKGLSHGFGCCRDHIFAMALVTLGHSNHGFHGFLGATHHIEHPTHQSRTAFIHLVA